MWAGLLHEVAKVCPRYRIVCSLLLLFHLSCKNTIPKIEIKQGRQLDLGLFFRMIHAYLHRLYLNLAIYTYSYNPTCSGANILGAIILCIVVIQILTLQKYCQHNSTHVLIIIITGQRVLCYLPQTLVPLNGGDLGPCRDDSV